MSALVGCPDWSTPLGADLCAIQFVARTGSRIFRRPLSDAERTRYLLQFQPWESSVDFEGAVQLTLSAMLQSPQFLYRAEVLPQGAEPGSVIAVPPYAMATRLSFFLWESGPDDALMDAASRDELQTEAQVRAQATRMLADDRAKRVLWDFPRQWLGLDRILLGENLVRTAQVDPAWTAATQASASTETQLFVQNTLSTGGNVPRPPHEPPGVGRRRDVARLRNRGARCALERGLAAGVAARGALHEGLVSSPATRTPARPLRPSGATRSSCASSASCPSRPLPAQTSRSRWSPRIRARRRTGCSSRRARAPRPARSATCR